MKKFTSFNKIPHIDKENPIYENLQAIEQYVKAGSDLYRHYDPIIGAELDSWSRKFALHRIGMVGDQLFFGQRVFGLSLGAQRLFLKFQTALHQKPGFNRYWFRYLSIYNGTAAPLESSSIAFGRSGGDIALFGKTCRTS